jgi:hypothetical protein
LSDSNPVRLLWVEPDDINSYDKSGPVRFGSVVSGDWDLETCSFKDELIFRSIKNRFNNNVEWKETELYDWYRAHIHSYKHQLYVRNFDNLKSLDLYLQGIDKLYRSISEFGYLSQRQILNSSLDSVDKTSDNPHSMMNEITVNICRDGTIAKRRSGNHRLSIAKINPNVSKIPVLVRARHAQWQSVRDEVINSPSPDQLNETTRKYLMHPDLDDIVPDSWRSNSL